MSDIIVLLIIVIMVVGAFYIGGVHNFYKLLAEAPRLQWLTFEEIVSLGYARFWVKRLLPIYHQMHYLQIRVPDELADPERAHIEREGLDMNTAPFYEYRFTQQWRRGKKKPDKRRSLIPQLLPV
ncbi:MAG: hypothetical protein NUV60_02310 [Patescibacteria group bacterium]|nr:hypothetical protein [Patescibacteria group bacterium]